MTFAATMEAPRTSCSVLKGECPQRRVADSSTIDSASYVRENDNSRESGGRVAMKWSGNGTGTAGGQVTEWRQHDGNELVAQQTGHCDANLCYLRDCDGDHVPDGSSDGDSASSSPSQRSRASDPARAADWAAGSSRRCSKIEGPAVTSSPSKVYDLPVNLMDFLLQLTETPCRDPKPATTTRSSFCSTAAPSSTSDRRSSNGSTSAQQAQSHDSPRGDCGGACSDKSARDGCASSMAAALSEESSEDNWERSADGPQLGGGEPLVRDLVADSNSETGRYGTAAQGSLPLDRFLCNTGRETTNSSSGSRRSRSRSSDLDLLNCCCYASVGGYTRAPEMRHSTVRPTTTMSSSLSMNRSSSFSTRENEQWEVCAKSCGDDAALFWAAAVAAAAASVKSQRPVSGSSDGGAWDLKSVLGPCTPPTTKAPPTSLLTQTTSIPSTATPYCTTPPLPEIYTSPRVAIISALAAGSLSAAATIGSSDDGDGDGPRSALLATLNSIHGLGGSNPGVSAGATDSPRVRTPAEGVGIATEGAELQGTRRAVNIPVDDSALVERRLHDGLVFNQAGATTLESMMFSTQSCSSFGGDTTKSLWQFESHDAGAPSLLSALECTSFAFSRELSSQALPQHLMGSGSSAYSLPLRSPSLDTSETVYSNCAAPAAAEVARMTSSEVVAPVSPSVLADDHGSHASRVVSPRHANCVVVANCEKGAAAEARTLSQSATRTREQNWLPPRPAGPCGGPGERVSGIMAGSNKPPMICRSAETTIEQEQRTGPLAGVASGQRINDNDRGFQQAPSRNFCFVEPTDLDQNAPDGCLQGVFNDTGGGPVCAAPMCELPPVPGEHPCPRGAMLECDMSLCCQPQGRCTGPMAPPPGAPWEYYRSGNGIPVSNINGGNMMGVAVEMPFPPPPLGAPAVGGSKRWQNLNIVLPLYIPEATIAVLRSTGENTYLFSDNQPSAQLLFSAAGCLCDSWATCLRLRVAVIHKCPELWVPRVAQVFNDILAAKLPRFSEPIRLRCTGIVKHTIQLRSSGGLTYRYDTIARLVAGEDQERLRAVLAALHHVLEEVNGKLACDADSTARNAGLEFRFSPCRELKVAIREGSLSQCGGIDALVSGGGSSSMSGWAQQFKVDGVVAGELRLERDKAVDTQIDPFFLHSDELRGRPVSVDLQGRLARAAFVDDAIYPKNFRPKVVYALNLAAARAAQQICGATMQPLAALLPNGFASVAAASHSVICTPAVPTGAARVATVSAHDGPRLQTAPPSRDCLAVQGSRMFIPGPPNTGPGAIGSPNLPGTSHFEPSSSGRSPPSSHQIVSSILYTMSSPAEAHSEYYARPPTSCTEINGTNSRNCPRGSVLGQNSMGFLGFQFGCRRQQPWSLRGNGSATPVYPQQLQRYQMHPGGVQNFPGTSPSGSSLQPQPIFEAPPSSFGSQWAFNSEPQFRGSQAASEAASQWAVKQQPNRLNRKAPNPVALVSAGDPAIVP